VISVSVCLSVCVWCLPVHNRIFGSSPTIFFVYASHARGSVLQKRRNDMLCTSAFMDDVILAHKPRVLDVAAQLKHSTRSLGLGYKLEKQLKLTVL